MEQLAGQTGILFLNENGGPNHVDNYCFAPIHANITADSLIYTPSYYYLGHFSKFITPELSVLVHHQVRAY